MLDFVRHARAWPRFSKITKQQYLWEGLTEATVLSCCFSWVWSSESVIWCCWFFASSYLHLVRIHCSYKNVLYWAGIVRHSLSANHIVRCFKLKKLKKDMRYQAEFLLPLKLEEILCYFVLWPPKNLGQSVYRMFYFRLV